MNAYFFRPSSRLSNSAREQCVSNIQNGMVYAMALDAIFSLFLWPKETNELLAAKFEAVVHITRTG